MILKGSQRAGAKQLGLHLLRTDENDHVEVHQVRGFISQDVVGALRETYAISRGTKCTQYMFSLSLSPPQFEHVPVKAFEDAIDEIEERMGLSGQPRVIVFHEKEGRRHAHCVWSRINAQTMKAVNLAHFKLKLRELSRQLYIEHGWDMPQGLLESQERNPLNFSREEWQQAKRIRRDPRAIKQIFQDCWAVSDSQKAYARALEARGYYLARGDRRGHVAIDWTGEIYAIARWTGVRTADVRKKLGSGDDLPAVEDVARKVLERFRQKDQAMAFDMLTEISGARDALNAQRRRLVEAQRQRRLELRVRQRQRHEEECRLRSERFRRGLKGLWDRVTGRHTAMRRQNERELQDAKLRDALEREEMVRTQLEERRLLQLQLRVRQREYDEKAAEAQRLRDTQPQLHIHPAAVNSPAGKRRHSIRPEP